jgi:glycosyltransferase involved in cell wall biosynthesis
LILKIGGTSKRKEPLVCICIPTFNAAATIKKTLTSILNQTHQNIIVHVIDNASTDQTLSECNNFTDQRLFIHKNITNIGAENNFNKCIYFAEGKYTAIFHADDVYELNIIEEQVKCLETNSQIGAVFTAALTINNDGRRVGQIGMVGDSLESIELFDFERLFKLILKRGNFIVCPSALVRTEIYKHEIRVWRGDMFGSSADLDVWLRIANNHLVAFIDMPLMRYRVNSDQFSNLVRQRTRRADFFLVLDYYLKLNRVKLVLTEQDQNNINQLEINDRIWRSINHYTNGYLDEAKILMYNLIKFENYLISIKTKRGCVNFLVIIILNFMYLIRIDRLGPTIIRYVRGKINR